MTCVPTHDKCPSPSHGPSSAGCPSTDLPGRERSGLVTFSSHSGTSSRRECRVVWAKKSRFVAAPYPVDAEGTVTTLGFSKGGPLSTISTTTRSLYSERRAMP